jgi:hypothetical protein
MTQYIPESIPKSPEERTRLKEKLKEGGSVSRLLGKAVYECVGKKCVL